VGVGENPRESLSELAKLGARLIIQRAVEDEFDAWLGRSRYERRPDYQRGLRHYLGLSINALHKLTAARQLPAEQEAPGHKLWFRRSQLDHWRSGRHNGAFAS
jgi:hypothetical protein